jgi:hypothetical protein
MSSRAAVTNPAQSMDHVRARGSIRAFSRAGKCCPDRGGLAIGFGVLWSADGRSLEVLHIPELGAERLFPVHMPERII